ncbi:hypothetical protein RHMOL_Rhmol04G0198400 [Rhododendron molle]|uniref:Uncharacterized protein n=1 Tax=Rhododendron molle TaxID=49168 RepID=A0ACC0P4T6_RHOML|nr:hypothetical protein RHMOL_Rhmol04G0198400 [Rhododendron molle]
MSMGVVIASVYNLGCFTHFPLRSPPVPVQELIEIAIARVGNNHFVQLFLQPHYPVPPFPTWWWDNASEQAKRWDARYATRITLWEEIMNTRPRGAGVEFGGNIDWKLNFHVFSIVDEISISYALLIHLLIKISTSYVSISYVLIIHLLIKIIGRSLLKVKQKKLIKVKKKTKTKIKVF